MNIIKLIIITLLVITLSACDSTQQFEEKIITNALKPMLYNPDTLKIDATGSVKLTNNTLILVCAMYRVTSKNGNTSPGVVYFTMGHNGEFPMLLNDGHTSMDTVNEVLPEISLCNVKMINNFTKRNN